MGRFDRPDTEIDGQMTLETWLNPEERLIAVSKVFAKARKQMTLAEQKCFILALTEIRFKEEPKSLCVSLDKKILGRILALNSDSDHLSVDIYDNIRNLPTHSYIEINEKDIDLQSNGYVITSVTRFRNAIRVRFNKEYIGLFTKLDRNYITMWSGDIFQMQSIRTARFYEFLRQSMDTRDSMHNVLCGIRVFKELFNIPASGKGSYMREKGGFDRANFEKNVIDPLCADMMHCKMIQLVVQPDGKYYVKEKQGKRVVGYRFYWTFSPYPSVAPADEVKQIQDRVDQDPQILKVAKDIIKGQMKPQPKKQPQFNDFDQREYDDTTYKILEHLEQWQ